jgi:hypothetical protein
VPRFSRQLELIADDIGFVLSHLAREILIENEGAGGKKDR